MIYDDVLPCFCCGKENYSGHGCNRDVVQHLKSSYLMIILPMIFKLDFDKSFEFHFFGEKWTFYYNPCGELSMKPSAEGYGDQYSSWYRQLWYLHCSMAQEQPWLSGELLIEEFEDY